MRVLALQSYHSLHVRLTDWFSLILSLELKMLTAHSLVFWACQAILLISVATRIVVGLEIGAKFKDNCTKTSLIAS